MFVTDMMPGGFKTWFKDIGGGVFISGLRGVAGNALRGLSPDKLISKNSLVANQGEVSAVSKTGIVSGKK